MKLNTILKGLVFALLNSSINAATIKSTRTVKVKKVSTTPAYDYTISDSVKKNPNISEAIKCFNDGGNYFYYMDEQHVCIDLFSNTSGRDVRILGSNTINCPSGYDGLIKDVTECFNTTLFWNILILSKVNNEVIERIVDTTPKTIAPTATITVVETTVTDNDDEPTFSTLPPKSPVADVVVENRESNCTTKSLFSIDKINENCLNDGGNELYFDYTPKSCESPKTVCVNHVDDSYEIITSDIFSCVAGEKGSFKDLKKCFKSMRKWTPQDSDEIFAERRRK